MQEEEDGGGEGDQSNQLAQPAWKEMKRDRGKEES